MPTLNFPVSSEQRTSSRINLRRGGIPVICHRGSQVLLSKANALGVRGAFVFTCNPLAVGTLFAIEFGFAPAVRMDARVRSMVPGVGMGVEFVALEPDCKSRLLKWMDGARLQKRQRCA